MISAGRHTKKPGLSECPGFFSGDNYFWAEAAVSFAGLLFWLFLTCFF